MPDIIVIGGGASGMAAAIRAAERGCSVWILEKKGRVGTKLLATGNGRCNVSNVDLDLSHFHGSMATWLCKQWKHVEAETVRSFWRDLGIDYIEGENGKLYPRSLQASSVLNALRRRLEELQVNIVTDCTVTQIQRLRSGFRLQAQQKQADAPMQLLTVTAKAVLLCAGGKAYPKLGADGEGAKLARSLKMQVNALRPALCRLRLDWSYLKRVSGVKVTVPALLCISGEGVQEEIGEVLFTDTGVSGPPILNLSRKAGEALETGQHVTLQLDLVPEMKAGELFSYLAGRMQRLSAWSLEEALEGFLPKKLVPVVIAEAGLDRLQQAGTLTKRHLGQLQMTMKAFTLTVSGLAGWEEAQITVGGVAAKEMTERLESRKHKGLFLAGEVLDLDGDCGGYNLQWAIGSGLYAAEGAEHFVKVEYVEAGNS